MTTRLRRQRNARSHSRQRNTAEHNLTFSRLITALGGALVLILLSATFLGDYLRVPGLKASASPALISPNNDQTQDRTSFTYTISENANVIIQVFGVNGSLVKTLSLVENQPAGQYVVLWDGTDVNNQVIEDGRYTIKVVAQGNSRSAEQSVEVLVDTQEPFLRLTNLQETTRVAESNLVIDGLTDPGTVVYQAGMTEPVPIDSQGQFQLTRQLAEGPNIIEVIASDQAGNTTRVSHEVTLVTRPPEITLIEPAVDAWLRNGIIEVRGAAPGAATVLINNQPAVILEDGTFSREIILQEGDNTLRVMASDDVGNSITEERIVHLKTAPPEITLNLENGTVLNQSTVELTGRTESGATVLVNNIVVPISTLGEFQTTINLINGSNEIRVEARDIAGNTSFLNRRVLFESPTAQNELTRLFNNLPSLSSVGTPLLIILPSLILVGYLLTRPVSLTLSADSESFTPGMPDEQRTMAFHLELSKSARTTVEILNKHNQVVATLTHRRQRGAGQHILYWDGYDDRGHAVPAGDYLVQAVASTPGANVRSATLITIYEDPLVHGQYSQQYAPQTERAETYRPIVRRTARRGRQTGN